jgi:hypothetical protein
MAVIRRRGLATVALATLVLGANAIVAAHAWRFTHFVAEGAKIQGKGARRSAA